MALQTNLILFLTGLVLLLLIYLLYLRGTIDRRVKRRMESEMESRIQEERKEAVEKSRAVLKGKVGEQMAPMLTEFDHRPSDARFVGSPVDYVVFDGYTEAKDGDGSGIEVVLMDVKTGDSKLSPVQEEIKRAAERGRLSWETLRLD